jgi:hypothetical protein
MKEKASFLLMLQVLDLIRESGVNQREAHCALKAAEAMTPEADLEVAPTLVIET